MTLERKIAQLFKMDEKHVAGMLILGVFILAFL